MTTNLDRYGLYEFVRESNRIEGIRRNPTEEEIRVHESFLQLPEVRVLDMERFVRIVQPGAKLREYQGMNVQVGNHLPPPGGPDIRGRLENILSDYATEALFSLQLSRTEHQRRVFYAHCLYETLHPFMDGNGRSGRALWLWMMGGIELVPLGFLHTFYYQTLAHSRLWMR